MTSHDSPHNNQRLRILWFANTPCGASSHLGLDVKIGGWLSALESELALNHHQIELHIAFRWAGDRIPPFKIGRVSYWPIQTCGTVLSRVLRRLNSPEDLANKEKEAFRGIAESVMPDIVHVHGTEDSFGYVQDVFDAPVIISLQGILNPYVEKYYSGLPEAKVRDQYGVIRVALGYTGFRSMARRSQQEKQILSRARWVMGRTHWDRRVARALAPNAVYFYGGEILREEFYKAEWEHQKTEKMKLLTVMSGGMYKGYETILRTAKLLKQSEFDFEWTVIGQSAHDDYIKISEAIEGIHHAGVNVRLIGRQSADAIVNEMRFANLYCQVSHIENSPNSVCEAMLVGMPVLATYAGGTGSLIDDDATGFLVQDGDSYAYCGAIMELKNDADKLIAVGKEARKVARYRHDSSVIGMQLCNAYRQIISGGGHD